MTDTAYRANMGSAVESLQRAQAAAGRCEALLYLRASDVGGEVARAVAHDAYAGAARIDSALRALESSLGIGRTG